MSRLRKLRKRVAIAALCLVIAWPPGAWLAAKFLIVQTEVASPDAIVVLSGPGTYVERTDWAAKLFQERRAPLVVLSNEGLLSGWSASEQRNLHFYELATRRLQQQGIAPQNIRVVSGIGAGTFPESVSLCAYAAEQKFARILVVTSAYHSRRARWSMQRSCAGKGIAVGIESPSPGIQTPRPLTWWLHASGWRMVAGEYVKMIYYRLMF